MALLTSNHWSVTQKVLAALLLDLRLWVAAPAAVQQNLFALCLKLSQVSSVFTLSTMRAWC